MRVHWVGVLGIVFASAVLRPAQAVWAEDTGTTQAAGGYMGVSLEPVAAGLRVATVAPSSPASQAGLMPGDVIVRARGIAPGSADTFTLSVRAAGPGTDYPVDVMRGDRRMHFSVTLGHAPRMGLSVGQPPPMLVAPVAHGPGPADLDALRGRVVLLDFWASWCGPCRMAMPVLNRMHQRYAAQGLSVVGVTDEGTNIAAQVALQMSLAYTMASEPSAASRFGVTALPTLVVIDRRGIVRHVSEGIDGDEIRQIDALVQRLLNEPAAQTSP